MKTLFLVNNKSYEPTFEESFKKIAQNSSFRFKTLDVQNLSYFVDKSSDSIEIYNGTQLIDTTPEDIFYIRARKPMASPTACLGFVLDASGFALNERPDTTEHNLRGSKIAQGFILKPHGVRFPNSFVTNVGNVASVLDLIEEKISFPFVVKQSGSKGEKVWKCESKAEFTTLMTELQEDPSKLILFQEYIENTFDIRVIVLYGEIIATISRSSADGFYNNVSQGGAAEKIDITDEEKTMALNAARVTKLELAGIDIVRSEHGPLLFEINKSPDITMFNEAAGFDLAEKIAQEFISKNTKN